jgi:hypothetical protein
MPIYPEQQHYTCMENYIGGVIVSVLVSSSVDRKFKPWSGQSKDYKIGICCFSTKHVVLRSKAHFVSLISIQLKINITVGDLHPLVWGEKPWQW